MRLIWHNFSDYTMSLIRVGLDTLESRREELTKRFFKRSVLPDKRDVSVTGRLRHARTFELLTSWTVKFPNSFISIFLVFSVALLVARRTNDRKVAGSRPTKVVYITMLTANRMGVNCPLWAAATLSSEL